MINAPKSQEKQVGQSPTLQKRQVTATEKNALATAGLALLVLLAAMFLAGLL